MGDKAEHYIKLRNRAGDLRNLLDECIHKLRCTESAVRELAKADFGEPGELSATDQRYLERSIADALYYTRMTEEINNGHITDLDHELRSLGLDPLSVIADDNTDQVWRSDDGSRQDHGRDG